MLECCCRKLKKFPKIPTDGWLSQHQLGFLYLLFWTFLYVFQGGQLGLKSWFQGEFGGLNEKKFPGSLSLAMTPPLQHTFNFYPDNVIKVIIIFLDSVVTEDHAKWVHHWAECVKLPISIIIEQNVWNFPQYSVVTTSLPCTISEIGRDLEIWLGVTQGHWKWHHSIDASTSQHKNSFFPRTIPQWNILNQDIADSPSLDAFKNRLP